MPPPMNPNMRDPNMRDQTRFLASLALGYAVVTFFWPLAYLTTCLTLLLYLYLKQEHLFDSALVSRTPPLPDAHLPLHDEWLANGGLTKLPPQNLASGSDDECCIICRDIPNDPTQITICGHVFCMECLDAWHAQGHGSCPQCTTRLWRESQDEWSRLETIVKFTAAEALVAIPLTVLTLCACFAYYTLLETTRIGISRMLLLLVFVLLSALVLTFAGYGWSFMLEQRRAQGIWWWGAGQDSQIQLAWRMSMSAFSVITGLWLLLMSVTFQAYMAPLMPMLDLRILGRV